MVGCFSLLRGMRGGSLNVVSISVLMDGAPENAPLVQIASRYEYSRSVRWKFFQSCIQSFFEIHQLILQHTYNHQKEQTPPACIHFL